MKLLLTRQEFLDNCTLGKLVVDGIFSCDTLEDPDRHLETDPTAKIDGDTAIPRGTYKVILDFSPRFNKELPHILDVPGYEGVRIHSGNSSRDTEGCILVGRNPKANWINDSRATFGLLYAVLEAAYDRGEDISLEVA